MDEFSFIQWIRNGQKKDRNVVIGIGDDCASLRVSGKKLHLITTDMLVDGTHFEQKKNKPKDIGRKAIACSISDIAAMGCFARYAVISICFPRKIETRFAKELFRGMKEKADEYNIKIVGGDIVSGKKVLVINVAMIGENDGLRPVARSGARTGDAIMVTGTLGGSILRKHIAFKPRLKEGLILNKKFNISSMIDISDGLAADLNHILEESKVGAILYEDKIPVSNDAKRLARKTGFTSHHHALHDGEDYELLFTLSDKESKKLSASNILPIQVTKIGRIKKAGGIYIQDSNGKQRKINPIGYEHFR